jgi:exonuclease SbcD
LDGSFSFIHAADLHLDSPFRGFEQITDIDESVREYIMGTLRNCTFTAFANIVRACVQNEVDFLVLSGDIFDQACRSLRAQLRFRDAVTELAQRNIKVFVAWGNHDCDDGGAGDRLSWPENVHFFTPGEVGSYEVVRRGREIARVYGISYPRREVSENYALRFRRDSKAPFAVGVLHCNVGGVTGHENYSPCQLSDLLQSRFDYWALGHVHTRRVLN